MNLGLGSSNRTSKDELFDPSRATLYLIADHVILKTQQKIAREGEYFTDM